MAVEKDNVGRVIRKKVPLSGIRKTIADRMKMSIVEYPQAMISATADATKLVQFKKDKAAEGIRFSYGDMFVKAASCALEKHPELNGIRTDKEITYFDNINIGMAANINGMLVEPVVCDTQSKTVEEISRDLKACYANLKVGKLMKVPLGCATFSLTSLGAYSVEFCTPILSPPNIAILGVGGIRNVVVVDENGEFAARPQVSLSVTIDHGSVDGVPLCEFLMDLVKAIENPEVSMYQTR